MLLTIKAKDRHFSDMGWLQTYWLFSFSDYYDPENVNHGSLRVFNDDIVQPNSGFGTHPHEEMEIISIVLHGEMTHKDTMGNEMLVKQYDVQRMTAGTGLQHSEWNNSDDTVSFFQIWILPDKKGLQPSYDQRCILPTYWKNRLALIASDHHHEQAVKLNSEASVFRSALDSGLEIIYEPDSEHCLFIYVIDGKLLVNGISAAKRDQIRVQDEIMIVIQATEHCDFILIDVPKC